MADREKLKGGIANLLSGADQSVKQRERYQRVEEVSGEPAVQAVADEAKPEQQQPQDATPQMKVEPTTPQDVRDLLNSIEDEELRKELEQRLYRKKLIGRGRPRKNDQLGRRMDGYDRTSLIINVEKWEKIKEIALRETLTLKEIVEYALDLVIERYESSHGEVKPLPREKKDINEIF